MRFEPFAKSKRWVTKLLVTLTCGILSTSISSSTICGQESSVEIVKRWDFGRSDDAKGLGWPDYWTRNTGLEYPKFLSIKITKKANSDEEMKGIDQLRRAYGQAKLAWEQRRLPWDITPERTPQELDLLLERSILNPYLEIQMDSFRAEVNSPFVAVESESVYGITCNIMGNDPSGEYEAIATLKLCDADKKVLLEQTTPPVTGETNWLTLTADTQYAYNKNIALAQVSLKVTPRSPNAFKGNFCFDSIRITRAPRLALQVNKPSRIYREGEPVIAECSAIGMATLQSSVELILKDHNGTIVDRSRQSLERGNASIDLPKLVSTRSNSTNSTAAKPTTYWNGRTQWTLPKLQPGYYELHTQLERTARRNALLKQAFVVLPTDDKYIVNPQVGWSIPEDLRPFERLETEQLVDLLREACVGKVKLPVWGDPHDPKTFDASMARIDRLQGAGITCIGVIATPPAKLRSHFSLARGDGTGSFLEDWTVAQSLLEPVVRETSIRILHYQIGWDNEVDFVSSGRVLTSLESLRRLLHRYGQESHVVASRNPMNSKTENKLIDRWQLTSNVPFTADEQRRILMASVSGSQTKPMPWFHTTPLPEDQYSMKARVQDLADRMLLLTEPRIQAGTVGWVFDPSSKQASVYSATQGPGTMFCPFRTLAGALTGFQKVGSLPSDAFGKNYVLTSGEECKLIAWSHSPFTANLYFGKSVVARDVWGRKVPIRSSKTEHGTMQSLELGAWPVLLQGVDLRAIRWRMGLELVTKKLDVLVDKVETVDIRFDNPLSTPAVGRVHLVCSALEPSDSPQSFQIDANTSEVLKIPVRVRAEANVGPTPIKAVFQIDDVPIVLEDRVQIGNDDFEFNLRYSFSKDNELLVEIEAINKIGEPSNFDCILRVTGRRWERRQILDLSSKAKRTFVLPDADQLIGKTLRLQCEQENKSRIINKQIVIERPTDN
jgi:hypothetical protein